MRPLIVIENPERWSLDIPGTDVVSARRYLSDPSYGAASQVTVYNLCRTYGYQTLGYYVSLLALARGHRPLPSVETLQDLRLAPVVRVVSRHLDELIQDSLRPLKGETFELSIYFGKNLAARYQRLSSLLFNHFPAPLLRARFERVEGQWGLESLTPIATSEIPTTHREFVVEAAVAYFRRPARSLARGPKHAYNIAILFNAAESWPPSDERAIKRFVKSAKRHGIDAEVIGPDDYARIAEFDALFIRETTAVNHHTYRFARRAEALGLVVIDDTRSIVRCTNKVYLAEALARAGVPTPKSVVLARGARASDAREVGLPCVVKEPDSSFSKGVRRADSEVQLDTLLGTAFERSELVLVQEYTPSDFDWRVGVLDKRPLYACRYHMATGHWQVIRTLNNGRRKFGKVETVHPSQVPPKVMDAALRAAAAIGSGLYGVDLKEFNGKPLVMEVNDNPSIESGYEDRTEGDQIYDAVMGWFRTRLDAKRNGNR